MFKNISKVVLASFLLTGAAKAADVYKDEFNTLTINVKAQAYVTHDYYGFKDTSKGRTVAPAELDGKVEVESYYFRMYNDKLTANAYVRLDIPTFGYSGPYNYSSDVNKNLALSTFGFINKAYGQMTYKDIGTLTFGRYKGFYSHIIDYSDVDIFVGTPAHNTKNSVFFGGSPETGIAYHGVFANESLIVGISADAGKDSVPYFATSDRKGVNFKKDYKGSAMVQYNIYDGLKIGAAYNITGFRVNSGVENTAQQNDLDRQRAQNIIGGINYNKGRTNIGITGSYQFYRYNLNTNKIMKEQSYGVEAGISYDISGMGVGFRPSAQFDFRKSYNELKTKNIDGSFTPEKKDYITVQALEVGLSYYVTPNLYYQGAAVLDLRTKARIAKADGVDTNKNKATPHHYFGVGVVYKF